MLEAPKLTIEKLITIDKSGMPKAPSLRQLIDKDVRELYIRDRTDTKEMYVKECIVIYYLGDPKSPAKQKGLILTSQDVRNTLYLYLICFLYTSSLSWRYTKNTAITWSFCKTAHETL